ncbi:hypothetical protein [Streptomyces sp. RPT161]|uniref:hypothetical protein n=1 Tax=Streptomyces sp. RPT161 TaxID=3015993 RepID=UPI0022B88F6D|nr:hypothetical protein [Streptomyces sp. RPT161]
MPQQEHGTPRGPGTPYIAPALGIDAFRDAAAAIRCLSAADGEGVHAILSGTDAPRHVAFALATIAVAICRRGGLDDAGITALLAEIIGTASDLILDQASPDATSKGR